MNRIYDALPIQMQNLACTLGGYQRTRARFSRHFYKTLSEWTQDPNPTDDGLRMIQRRRLLELTELARKAVPFYSEIPPPSSAADPDRAIEETLASIPILEKSAYRENFENMINKTLASDQIRYSQTSGTTGSALRLAHTPKAVAEEYATVWRMRRACGVGLNDAHLTFGGQLVVPYEQAEPPFWRQNFFNRQTLFSVHHMTPANLDLYVDAIHRTRASYVMGYPSSLHLVARAMLESGRPVPKGKFQAVFTSSESLLAFQRESIEKGFACRTWDRYGTSEFAVSMTECKHGNLHVDMEYCLVEVEIEEETSEYIRGPLLVTGFANDATPFLRYRIGDVGTRLKGTCPCGRAGHVFLDVDGRNDDYIVTPDGRQVGRLDHIFKSQKKILEAQIVQDTRHAIDVFVVPAEGYGDADDRNLRHEIGLRLGSEIHVDIQIVKNITRERNGKFRAVKSTVGGSVG